MQFEALGEELWIMAFEYLPSSALRRLSSASKYLHAVCIPILYRYIDLSAPKVWPVPTDARKALAKRIQT